MNKKLSKKLMLNKETIHTLTNDELTGVAGGATAGNGCGTNTCRTCLMTYPCCGGSGGDTISCNATCQRSWCNFTCLLTA